MNLVEKYKSDFLNPFWYSDQHGRIYHSAAHAAYAKEKDKNLNIKYHFFDDEFNSFDWKNDTNESTDDLFKERAQYIRDNYDYILLCFSGGVDSTKMLETFVYNNIFVDEILSVGAFSQDLHPESEEDENHNNDIYINVKNVLADLPIHKNTKVTYYDYSPLFTNPNQFTLIQKYGPEWIDWTGSYRSPHNLFWYDLKKFIPIPPDKKVAMLMGTDKIRWFWDEDSNKSYITYTDIHVSDYGNNYFDEHFIRENFYIYPHITSMKMMRRAGHILKNIYYGLIAENKWNEAHAMKDQKQTKVYVNAYLAPKHLPIWKSKKSYTTALSSRDQFMFRKQNSDIGNFFREGIRLFQSKGGTVRNKYPFFVDKYWLE